MRFFVFFFAILSCLFNYSSVFAVENLYGYPERIMGLEQRITLSCDSDPFEKTEIVQSLVNNVSHNRTNFVQPVVDWTNRSLSNMVSDLLFIQETKLRLKWHNLNNTASSYRINANLALPNNGGIGYDEVSERAVDPYPIRIALGNEIHKLIMNYDGGNVNHPNQHQPGNCRLRCTVPNSQTIMYTNPITVAQYNSDSYKLLRAVEVCRRKAIDPHRNNFADLHSDIPVATGIIMATHLINNNALTVNAGNSDINFFWRKNNQNYNQGIYHIFSEDNNTRMTNFTRLADRYRQEIGMANSIGTLIRQIEDHAPGVFGFSQVNYDMDDLEEAFGNLSLNS